MRPVADPDEQRGLVEPDRVTAFDGCGSGNASDDGDPRAFERRDHCLRLAAPAVLARPQEDGALAPDEGRVIGVDRVRVARIVLGDDNLGAGVLQ